MTTPPFDLFASALRFHPDGGVHAAERRMTGDGSDAWQLAAFRVATDADVHADHWEMHPDADEAVCCLRGGVRLHFRGTGDGDAGETVRLRAGEGVVVPRGRWHRIGLDEPSELMSVTRRDGTRLEERAS